jgi:hypothetical protein
MRASSLITVAILGVLGVACLLLLTGHAATGLPQITNGESARWESPTGQSATPVVVELFTSEGCSSCPPADRLLARLDQTQPVPGAQIIALEEHVDYWNDLGWTDPFSSAQFSDRQAGYVRSLRADTPYTPQMIVDGATQFVGSDERDALAAIVKAARVPKSRVELKQREDTKARPGTVPLRVRVQSLAGRSGGDAADVFLAITENGLSSNVTRGENSGARLNHRAVVRELRVLGQATPNGSFAGEPDVNLAKGWERGNLRAVAFVQARGSRRILGAASVALPAPGKGP